MHKGYIVTKQELRERFNSYSEFFIENKIYLRLLSWNQSFSEHELPIAFPIDIKILEKDKLEHEKFCETTTNEYISLHNFLDDYFHWHTNYQLLPDYPTTEDIKTRLEHPLIVWNLTTQILVNKWAKGKTKKEIFKILNSSPEKWYCRTDLPVGSLPAFAPSRKWKNYYLNHPNPKFSTFQKVKEHIIEKYKKPFLLNYNEKATSHFEFKAGKLPAYKTFLGVELELETLTKKAEEILTKTLGEHCIFKRDGSVDKGVEICSAPATLDVHKKEFKAFFLDTNHGLEVKPNCGLHIHVDRSKIGQTHLAKILMFMNNPKNNTKIEKLSGRKANEYCKREDYSWSSLVNNSRNNKYSRVNHSPEKTIEFRLFASTLDYTIFSRSLEFVQAVIDYTSSGEHSCSIKESITWKPFVSYIQQKHQFYPVLHKYLKETV